MANIQVPALPAATELLDSDLLHIRQGATDKKLTGEQAKSFFQGLSEWLATTDYPVNSYIKGSDGELYRALAPSGPSSAPVDPVGDLTGVWVSVASGAGADKSQWPTTSPAADSEHDVTISAGVVLNSLGTFDLVLSSPITKQIDAAWAVGDNAGGLFSGTVAASSTYHLFIIRRDSDGVIDAGFDSDSSGANVPAGWSSFRRLRSYITDVSANIIETYQIGDYFGFINRILDIDTTAPTTNGVLVPLSVPSGLNSICYSGIVNMSVGVGGAVLVTSPVETDSVPTTQNSTIDSNSSGQRASTQISKYVDSLGQLRYRTDTAPLGYLRFQTEGWIDDRSE